MGVRSAKLTTVASSNPHPLSDEIFALGYFFYAASYIHCFTTDFQLDKKASKTDAHIALQSQSGLHFDSIYACVYSTVYTHTVLCS